MPATSGSPTQIATSQPTKAALSNTPADQFQSGDLGYVQEELVAGRCPVFALVSAGGPTVDGTMVLSVYQNATARWVNLAVLGVGTISVANIAELQALPNGSFKEGTWVYVRSVRAWWELASGLGATTDGITVVTAQTGGAARWVRQDANDPYWGYTVAWFVDPVAGNDENTGIASNAALKTVAELCRRLRMIQTGVAYTVAVLSDVPATDVCNPQLQQITGGGSATIYGSSLTFTGVRTVVVAGTTTSTTQTDPTQPQATAQAEISDATQNFVGQTGRMIVTAAGTTAYILTPKTAGVASTVARVTDWTTSANTFAASPGAGVAYSIVTLTKFRAQVNQGSSMAVAGTSPATRAALVFKDLEFDDIGNNVRAFVGIMNVSLVNCVLSNANGGTGFFPFFGLVAGTVGFVTVMFNNADPGNTGSIRTFQLGPTAGVKFTFGNGCGARGLRLDPVASPASISGICFQGGFYQCGASGAVLGNMLQLIGGASSGQWVGVYNDFEVPTNSTASFIAGLNINEINAGASIQGSVYGLAGQAGLNVAGIRVQGGAKVNFRNNLAALGAGTATTTIGIAPSGTGQQLSVDDLATLLPPLSQYVGAAWTAIAPALTAMTTMAQYVAAPFSRNAQNYDSGSAFIKF